VTRAERPWRAAVAGRSRALALAVALSFLLPLQGFAVVAPGASPLVAVESWSSGATVLRPEVHVLLRNRTNEPIRFLLELGAGAAPHCDPGNAELSASLATRWGRRSLASTATTLGVVPAGGWTHRSLVTGFSGGGAPCRVPYRLTLRDSRQHEWRIEGVVDAPVERSVETGWISAAELHLDRIVERNRMLRKPGLILRVLAENRGHVAASIAITDIRFSCPGSEQPKWDLQQGTVQGEGVGPALILPSHAHVFVFGVDPPEGGALGDCRGSVEVSALERHGDRILKVYDFSLEPDGYVDVGEHGFR
jgi:hypothetical protein